MALGDRHSPSERLAMAVGSLAGDHGGGRAGSCSVSAKTPVSSRSKEPAVAAGLRQISLSMESDIPTPSAVVSTTGCRIIGVE
jgi:hypothetical protein